MGNSVTAWVAFKDETDFLAFHDAACADHGIPRPGENVATDALDMDAQWTTAYVDPVLDDMTLKALVPVEDVATYGLTETSPPKVTTDPETGIEATDAIPVDLGHAKPVDADEWLAANPPPLEES
jgi:hypothetical protein